MPGPIVTEDGEEEYFVDRVIDKRVRGVGKQYLVRWRGPHRSLPRPLSCPSLSLTALAVTHAQHRRDLAAVPLPSSSPLTTPPNTPSASRPPSPSSPTSSLVPPVSSRTAASVLAAPAPASVSSDSDSDIIPLAAPPIAIQRTAAKMSNLTIATQISQSHAPCITEGDITPKCLKDFERFSKRYFAHKKVEPADQVSKIIYNLEPLNIQLWIFTNAEELIVLTFPEFMGRLRAKWLLDGWEYDIAEVLNSFQHDTPFKSWSLKVREANTMLIAVEDLHVTEKKMRAHLRSLAPPNCHKLGLNS
ncbi:hypothetical protein LshimejAT787_0309520 [Lyophyllum shimeji]|uniref:Chromo domain-containing protein n=1 Tax=Lyophyllum shimeji TaxID=47721 RepID=A0A9P3PIN5_LYOSH|nr:hypothetical protein LshimejAT787_0309520 [Lyophyllum shimeji]